MVIASKPKTRPTVHHKRRTGQHQRQTKPFMKTYWPYLPLLGLAAIVNSVIGQSSTLSTAATTSSSASRLQVWTNSGPWPTAIILCLVAAGAIIVVTRHALAWQRVLIKGEDLFIKHHSLDLLLAVFILAGVVLTRSV